MKDGIVIRFKEDSVPHERYPPFPPIPGYPRQPLWCSWGSCPRAGQSLPADAPSPGPCSPFNCGWIASRDETSTIESEMT